MLNHVLHVFGAAPNGGEWHTLLNLIEFLNRHDVNSTVVDLSDQDAVDIHPETETIPRYTYIPREATETAEQCLDRALNRCTFSVIQSWGDDGNLACLRAINNLPAIPPLLLRVSSARNSLQANMPEAPATAQMQKETAKLSSHAFACIYTSDDVRQLHESMEYCPQQSVVIYNGVCTKTFCPYRTLDTGRQTRINEEKQRLGLERYRWVIGHSGRYSPYVKNQLGFIDAASELARIRDDVHFIMAGDGVIAENTDIRDRIAQQRLSAHLSLLGPRHDMDIVYHLADIWSSVSRTEAFSNTVLEAMSCGKIVTSTNVGMPQLTIADPTLILNPPEEFPAESRWARQQTAMWQAVFSQTTNGLSKIQQHNRTTILQRFDSESNFQDYLRLYRKAATV